MAQRLRLSGKTLQGPKENLRSSTIHMFAYIAVFAQITAAWIGGVNKTVTGEEEKAKIACSAQTEFTGVH
jgi:hypothetical protein